MPSPYRFGKRPPKHDPRTLRFADYLTPALPAPPESHDVLTPVYANLGTSDTSVLFPMDGNDVLGDCTVAALAHASTAYHGLVGKREIMARGDVVRLYLDLTGGADTGLEELDVLGYWRKHRVSDEQILAYLAIDPKEHTHIKSAIAIFGGVYLGFNVQENCIADFTARRPWTPGPLTGDGHAVFAVAYDADMLTVLTWGNTQRATWEWWDACVDEAYVILPPEARSTAFAPGFSFAALQSDLNALAA